MSSVCGRSQQTGAGLEWVQAAAQELIEEQRADGGWAQRDTMGSDAYATGTALVALHQAAGRAPTEAFYRRGIRHLLAAQREDGTWYVRSRSKPFQTYFESGFPHGKDQFISLAASSWATTALALALPAAEDKPDAARVAPLRQAHAHNDYAHKRPLLDALEQGFCSVEANVFLVGDELLVGHERRDLRPERTLAKLYLDPLKERIQANGGRVYRDGPRFYLLINVKTEARPTYAAVDKQLARYGDMLSATRNSKFEPGAITVVISGNRDRETIAGQKVRYAGIDGRPADLDSDAPAHLLPWISASWGSVFRWKGKGPMPDAERAKLKEFVAKAHRHGRLVRFWATPEEPAVWKELLAAEVDLINTDRLVELRQYLLDHPPERRKP